MLEDGKEDVNIYQLTTLEKKLNIKKIIIIILIIVILLMLLFIFRRAIYIIKQHKVYEQYEIQTIALKIQEEEKLAELEEIRQAKIPKLTQTRKR